jgi:hypothetical protein
MMDENSNERETTTNDSDAESWLDQDELLANLVGLANSVTAAGARVGADISLEADITLTAGGLLVSGRLISAQQYFAGLRGQIEQMQHEDDLSAMVRSELAEFFNMIAQTYNEPEGSGRIGFIHLGDVSFLPSSGSPVVAPRSFWRARLTAVDGFMLGRLASSG